MFTMTVITNYLEGEHTGTWTFETMEALLGFIEEDLKKEVTATSFVYTIARTSM